MIIILSLILLFVLSLIFYQDIKDRTIHIILPMVLFLVALTINIYSRQLNVYDIFYNCCFILINIIGLVLYFSIKNNKLVNPIDTHIGFGDILFFISITPLFQLKRFVLFFIIGLLFSLLSYGILLLFKKVRTIPLAGYLALFLIINLICKNIFKINTLF